MHHAIVPTLDPAGEESTVGIDVSRIVGTSFRIYLLRWRPHLAAAAIAQLPALVPTLVLISLLLRATIDVLLQRSVDAVAPVVIYASLLLVMAFFSAFLFVLMGAAACQLVEFWLEDQRVTLVGAYRMALRRFWRLAGAMLALFAFVFGGWLAFGAFLAIVYVGFLVVFQIDLAGDPRTYYVALGISALLAIVAGLVLVDALVRWSVFLQVVVIEGRGPLESLTRSADLVRGNWWRTAGAMALLAIIPLLLSLLVTVALDLASLPVVRANLLPIELTNAIAVAISQILLSPVPAIGVTVLYYRLRDGRQAWDRIDSRMRGYGRKRDDHVTEGLRPG